MRKIIFTLIILLFFFGNVNAVTLPTTIQADSAILINLDENEVIYEKNPDKIEILASLTKIMTAYTAINHVDDLDKKVTITENDISGLEGFTVAGIEVGDKLSYRDLLYGTILLSAADTAKALANHISGSEPKFVELMNQEAKKLNLRNSNFEDSFGGHDDNIATAREIGKLLQIALKNKDFKQIFETTVYQMSNGIFVVNYTRSVASFHGLDDKLITGNKSGYTPEAGLLLASTATINNTNYALVVMNCKPNEWKSTHVLDTYRVYEYVKTQTFEKRTLLKKDTLLKKIKVVNGTIDEYPVYLDRDITKILSDEDYKKIKIEYNIVDKIDHTSKVGDNIGFVDIFIGNELIASESISLKDKLYETNDNEEEKQKVLIPTFAMIISFTLVVIFAGKLFFKTTKKKRKKKSKK